MLSVESRLVLMVVSYSRYDIDVDCTYSNTLDIYRIGMKWSSRPHSFTVTIRYSSLGPVAIEFIRKRNLGMAVSPCYPKSPNGEGEPGCKQNTWIEALMISSLPQVTRNSLPEFQLPRDLSKGEQIRLVRESKVDSVRVDHSFTIDWWVEHLTREGGIGCSTPHFRPF